MHHSDMKHMLDDMIEHPDEMIVDSPSKRAALYTTSEGEAVLLEGDFSGPEEEQDEDIHQFVNRINRRWGHRED